MWNHDKLGFSAARLKRIFHVMDDTIEPGRQADVVLIDPQALRAYDSEAGTRLEYRDVLGHEMMVNRSEGVVAGVWIAGRRAWNGREFTPELGKERFGRVLRVDGNTPPPIPFVDARHDDSDAREVA